SVRGFGDEVHREDTSRRGHESHTKKHGDGFVVGGRVYGYTNRDITRGCDAHGRPLRVGVVRDIHPTEAAVVQRIFDLYGNLHLGLKAIAKTLMQEGAPPPTAF